MIIKEKIIMKLILNQIYFCIELFEKKCIKILSEWCMIFKYLTVVMNYKYILFWSDICALSEKACCKMRF
ncbi:LOW QUALITY PROTEIN: uncharacterized protein T551_02787 [Pneumocystis jirovecii RU7]|uniref:Uncharacterized protein n=1 Tax=Pneumocystis jirovecii (strain RU7) TaxID=1408657 RepID=A0A0W4ZHJ1_PNEJ7|nr:LOW QUALITY PROTEIN: uncharacterized protein T551_02787 [Pneumocystis jirovecii RU7]KTW27820.1 LOW QUALITY PROTEIN: hypothetical protein T551_02787 [Pneumocystis jirovecii RU7]